LPSSAKGEGRGGVAWTATGWQIPRSHGEPPDARGSKKMTKCLREFCGTWLCFVVLSRDKCNGCRASSRLMTSNPFKKINHLCSWIRPSFSRPPTTNQVVGSSNLSGRANFSYRDNVLARFTCPARRRNQVVAGELRAPGVLPGSRACSEACCETRAPPSPATSPATTATIRSPNR